MSRRMTALLVAVSLAGPASAADWELAEEVGWSAPEPALPVIDGRSFAARESLSERWLLSRPRKGNRKRKRKQGEALRGGGIALSALGFLGTVASGTLYLDGGGRWSRAGRDGGWGLLASTGVLAGGIAMGVAGGAIIRNNTKKKGKGGRGKKGKKGGRR